MQIPQSLIDLIDSGAHAHLVTMNKDGSPHVTVVWIGVENGEIVSAHLPRNQKVRNIERDGRVVLSLEASTLSDFGLKEYAVVHGTARITEGGAPELLQKLAYIYMGKGVKFPPMENPPPGYVTRIRVARIEGVGPWVVK
ncbi:MAG: PPOX class F420-dependent oxidoreductase [Chloroflexi bacterium]|nr:PPOX class F420-dependent oxidoreductase [Chloroflexota bacterium]